MENKYTAAKRNGQHVLVQIDQAEFPESPTTWWGEDAPIIACWHRRYVFGHPDGKDRIKDLIRNSKAYKGSWESEELHTPSGGFYPNKNFLDLDDWRDLGVAAIKAGCVIKPVYLYDHSGFSVSLSNTSYPFTCPWDSGQVGLIVWSLEQRELIHGGPFRNTPKRLRTDLEIFTGYFNEWADFIHNKVYTVTVFDPVTGEDLDYCGDFYGWEYTTGDALDEYFDIDPATLRPCDPQAA